MSARAGALNIRSPLIRHRPWISDATWIAHESLPLFSRFAALMPRRGFWRLGPNGVTQVPERGDGPDLCAFVADRFARSEPCVFHAGEYRWSTSIDEAMGGVSSQPPVEVIDSLGSLWVFDADFVVAASVGRRDWTWRLCVEQEGSVLIAVDRKNRPRFLAKNLRVGAR